jgi:hypothetical protein
MAVVILKPQHFKATTQGKEKSKVQREKRVISLIFRFLEALTYQKIYLPTFS